MRPSSHEVMRLSVSACDRIVQLKEYGWSWVVVREHIDCGKKQADCHG